MANKEKEIAWIDVETNGTEDRKNVLLEVACIITDTQLNILDEVGYQAIIQYSAEEVAAIKEVTIPYVIDMHTKTGLWDKLPEGKPLGDVDMELYTYLKSFAPEANTMRLGGNSITLDRNFINRYLPVSGSHLHYRSIDVSSVAGLAQYWYNGLQFSKKNVHSAMDDIRESIEELRWLRGTVFKGMS
jgi:oligoribonuclease